MSWSRSRSQDIYFSNASMWFARLCTWTLSLGLSVCFRDIKQPHRLGSPAFRCCWQSCCHRVSRLSALWVEMFVFLVIPPSERLRLHSLRQVLRHNTMIPRKTWIMIVELFISLIRKSLSRICHCDWWTLLEERMWWDVCKDVHASVIMHMLGHSMPTCT